jgi:hypothetical protein
MTSVAMFAKFELRFFPVREAKSRAGYQAGPTRTFASLGELAIHDEHRFPSACASALSAYPDGPVTMAS